MRFDDVDLSAVIIAVVLFEVINFSAQFRFLNVLGIDCPTNAELSDLLLHWTYVTDLVVCVPNYRLSSQRVISDSLTLRFTRYDTANGHTYIRTQRVFNYLCSALIKPESN